MRLVVLPGMDGGAELSATFRDAIPFETEGVAYPPEELLGYDALEALLRSRLEGVGEHVLVAESFSGPVAVRLAADPPPSLRGLVLVASFLRDLVRIQFGIEIFPGVGEGVEATNLDCSGTSNAVVLLEDL